MIATLFQKIPVTAAPHAPSLAALRFAPIGSQEPSDVTTAVFADTPVPSHVSTRFNAAVVTSCPTDDSDGSSASTASIDARNSTPAASTAATVGETVAVGITSADADASTSQKK